MKSPSLWLIWLVALAVSAQESRDLSYKRPIDAAPRDLPAARPPALPEAIRPAPARRPVPPERRRTDSRRAETRPPVRDPFAAVYGMADAAAERTAADLAAGYGYREYYKVGFYQALHQSLHRPAPGSFDYAQGLRAGRFDPRLRADAARLGEDAAQKDAPARAEEEVARQFEDLSRDPLRSPVAPRFDTPQFNAAVDYPAPTLEAVFGLYPLHDYRDWSGRSVRFYDNWRPDPYRLYGYSDYSECYDDRWRNPGFALDCFRQDRRAAAAYYRLQKTEREAFERRFLAEYSGYLNAQAARYAEPAHHTGYRDGWSYGCTINAEWHFRQGYYDGAAQALDVEAGNTYARAFPRIYRTAYQDAFDRWNNTPAPRMERLRLTDGDDDGIFEPGDTVLLQADLVNYGGAPGRLVWRAEGRALEGTGREITLPARTRLDTERALQVRISPNTRPNETYPGAVHLGGHSLTFDIPVAWPLVLDDPVVVSRDNRAGSAEMTLTVFNQSRREVRDAELTWNDRREPLRRLGPSERYTVRIDLSGFDALDMLAGYAGFDAVLTHDGTTWDRLDYRLPDQVTDLDNDDLLQELMDLAARRAPHHDRVARVHDLWLRRMEADWQAAAADNGNPYKQDRRRGGGQTALGRLVQAYRDARGRLASPSVITDLRPLLLAQAETLPGTHPFLRKQVRKLADQLR